MVYYKNDEHQRENTALHFALSFHINWNHDIYTRKRPTSQPIFQGSIHLPESVNPQTFDTYSTILNFLWLLLSRVQNNDEAWPFSGNKAACSARSLSFNRIDRWHETKEMPACATWYGVRDCTKSNLIIDYKHWARSWSRFLGSQPAGDISHKPSGRLSLLYTRPMVTFPAKEITPLADTKLYCLVTEAHRCK